MYLLREWVEKEGKEAEEEWQRKIKEAELRPSAMEKDLESEKTRASLLEREQEDTKYSLKISEVSRALHLRAIEEGQRKVDKVEVRVSWRERGL